MTAVKDGKRSLVLEVMGLPHPYLCGELPSTWGGIYDPLPLIFLPKSGPTNVTKGRKMRLSRDFYDRPTPLVAQHLLGQRLVYGPYRGIITETEAYRGEDDPACHAARGKTPRHAVIYGPPGHAYVYFIYGRYFCFNIVTETEGMPAAVLIRGLLLDTPESLFLDGPGRLCRHLNISREDNGTDLISSPSFYMEETALRPPFKTTPRIGIKVGTDKPWRYVVINPLLNLLD